MTLAPFHRFHCIVPDRLSPHQSTNTSKGRVPISAPILQPYTASALSLATHSHPLANHAVCQSWYGLSRYHFIPLLTHSTGDVANKRFDYVIVGEHIPVDRLAIGHLNEVIFLQVEE